MNRAGWLGAAVLGAAWGVNVAPPGFGEAMLDHVAVVAVAAPLIALGIAGTRFDPVPRRPAWFSPIGASLVELLVVWLWHAPPLHAFARQQALGWGLEQASFLAVSLWLWVSALGGGPALRAERALGGVAGLLFTSMHMTLLGALLTVAERPLYACHGPGSMPDQQLGGAIMLLVGGAAYLAGGVGLVADLLSPRTATR